MDKKLSKLQKSILDTIPKLATSRIYWKEGWEDGWTLARDLLYPCFGDDQNKHRASLSRSIKRLYDRGLIECAYTPSRLKVRLMRDNT